MVKYLRARKIELTVINKATLEPIYRAIRKLNLPVDPDDEAASLNVKEWIGEKLNTLTGMSVLVFKGYFCI